MQRLSLLVMVFSLVGFLGAGCQGEEPTEECLTPALSAAKAWFLEEDRSLEGWSAQQLLGAAELVHWIGERSQPIAELPVVDEVFYQLSHLADDADEDELMPYFKRVAIIWLIMNDDRSYEGYLDIALSLTAADPDNAVAWALLAEATWQRGHFSTYADAYNRVNAATEATLRAQNYRRDIIAALEKIGHDSLEARRELLRLPLPWETRNMFVRHVTLLSMARHVGRFFNAKVDGGREVVMKYLAQNTIALYGGHAVYVYIYANNFCRSEDADTPRLSDLFTRQRAILLAETVALERIGRHGSPDEVNRAVFQPETVRAEVFDAHPDKVETLRLGTWLTAFAEASEEAQASERAERVGPRGTRGYSYGPGGEHARADVFGPGGPMPYSDDEEVQTHVIRCSDWDELFQAHAAGELQAKYGVVQVPDRIIGPFPSFFRFIYVTEIEPSSYMYFFITPPWERDVDVWGHVFIPSRSHDVSAQETAKIEMFGPLSRSTYGLVEVEIKSTPRSGWYEVRRIED